MIGNEIEKSDQFHEQSKPIFSQIEGQEIETALQSVVSLGFLGFPRFPNSPSPPRDSLFHTSHAVEIFLALGPNMSQALDRS